MQVQSKNQQVADTINKILQTPREGIVHLDLILINEGEGFTQFGVVRFTERSSFEATLEKIASLAGPKHGASARFEKGVLALVLSEVSLSGHAGTPFESILSLDHGNLSFRVPGIEEKIPFVDSHLVAHVVNQQGMATSVTVDTIRPEDFPPGSTVRSNKGAVTLEQIAKEGPRRITLKETVEIPHSGKKTLIMDNGYNYFVITHKEQVQ